MSNAPQPGPSGPPAAAAAAVLVHSQPVPEDAVPIRGPDFDSPLDLNTLLGGYERIGFQATSLGRAIHIVNKMASTLFFSQNKPNSNRPTFSVLGVFRMNHSPRTSLPTTSPQRFALQPSVQFSLGTLQILFHLD